MAVVGQKYEKRWRLDHTGRLGAVWRLQSLTYDVGTSQFVEKWVCIKAAAATHEAPGGGGGEGGKRDRDMARVEEVEVPVKAPKRKRRRRPRVVVAEQAGKAEDGHADDEDEDYDGQEHKAGKAKHGKTQHKSSEADLDHSRDDDDDSSEAGRDQEANQNKAASRRKGQPTQHGTAEVAGGNAKRMRAKHAGGTA